MTAKTVPIKAVALVNPAVRIRSAVELIEVAAEQAYPWTAESRRTADELDFVARTARGLTAQPPLLLVSGERDHPAFRTDATDPNTVELTTVSDLAHPLAEEPGLEPAPQLPTAKAVDKILTQWFARQLGPN